MNKRLGFIALALLFSPVLVHASCDAVKADIDAKIKANGVSNYTLDVVSADQAGHGGGKVVGQCEDGKQIVYSRGEGVASADNSTAKPAHHGHSMKSDAAKSDATKKSDAMDNNMMMSPAPSSSSH